MTEQPGLQYFSSAWPSSLRWSSPGSAHAYGVRMLVEAACYALIALGLNIQWGYAGLFNSGVMGFIAIAAFASMIVSYPVNWLFWDGQGPGMLARAGLLLIIGGCSPI